MRQGGDTKTIFHVLGICDDGFMLPRHVKTHQTVLIVCSSPYVTYNSIKLFLKEKHGLDGNFYISLIKGKIKRKCKKLK